MKKLNIDFIDVKATNDSISLEDTLSFAKDVAIDSAFGVLFGVVSTVGDVGSGCLKVLDGDFNGVAKIAKKRVEGVISGTIGSVKSGVALAEASYRSIAKDEFFFTHENKIHVTRLCQLGIYSMTSGVIIGDAEPEGEACKFEGDTCKLPGVENGVFKGDAQDLQLLTEQGQIEGTVHLQEGEYTRSDIPKKEFLEAHSIEDTKGWQVHHLHPLSEGGTDNPSNMVLIDPENHAKITAAHADYYDWKK